MFLKTMNPRYITVFGDCFRYAPPGKRPVWYAWHEIAGALA